MIEATNLTKRYGKTVAVSHEVSLYSPARAR